MKVETIKFEVEVEITSTDKESRKDAVKESKRNLIDFTTHTGSYKVKSLKAKLTK